MNSEDLRGGWAEYAQSILAKLKELHLEHKETKSSLDQLKMSIARLEHNQKELEDFKKWKEEVTNVWSASHMLEAQKEIYVQKGKWSVVYGVIIAVNIIWGVVLAAFKLQ
jgi:hypothetical protein